MKKLLLLIACTLPGILRAQLTAGAAGLTIKAGTTLSAGGLVLQPSADLSLVSNIISRSSASEAVGNGNSISCVYTFSAPFTFSGTAGLYYEDGALAGNTENALEITHAGASPPVWIFTTGSMVNTSANYISQTFAGTTLARITASSATLPLPLTLLSFTAVKDGYGRTALLRWEMAAGSPEAIVYYEAEHSTDSRTFSAIGRIAADTNHVYSLTHHEPVPGRNYYRLRMPDRDGNVAFSQVRQIDFGMEEPVLQVAPNPLTHLVTLYCSDASLKGTAGTVSDINGRVVLRFHLEAQRTPLTASEWLPGIYFIRLANGASFKVVKLR